jgi:hypothetical protein
MRLGAGFITRIFGGDVSSIGLNASCLKMTKGVSANTYSLIFATLTGSILTCVEIKESGILNWKTVQSHQEDTDDSYRQP